MAGKHSAMTRIDSAPDGSKRILELTSQGELVHELGTIHGPALHLRLDVPDFFLGLFWELFC